MRVKQTNTEVREIMKQNVVRQWEIAEKLGISESGLSKEFRREMEPRVKERVMAAIQEIINDHLRED